MNSLLTVFDSLRKAQKELALETGQSKNSALVSVMAALDRARASILEANAADVEKARSGGMKDALIDRLLLNDRRITDMIEGIDTVIRREEPVNKVLKGWTLPNGLFIEELSVPLGVAAIIYESRPNVTVDASVLAYKAGCSILLRGSSAALESNRAIVAAIKDGLNAGGGVPGAVELADSGDRNDVDTILAARGKIDVVLPRGGRELIRRVVDNAKVPVIETGEGNCHIYVDESADMESAAAIIEDAKLTKPGACNSLETLLVHRDAAERLMPALARRLTGKAELRCDSRAKEAIGPVPPGLGLRDALPSDWETEFLDYILAVRTVDSLDEAIEHINTFGTKHSEAILTNNLSRAEEFRSRVDAACVYVNASIRFTDGGQFGFGTELGISTQKFHARGPMGLEALTTIQYRISGSGQTRG
ncbi:glutamate-5-semialdehyde dehydrogenase [Treponema sp. OttesenSCG-928-L16]|nr:glutamate-5-semialdehyde dehydrogenase [Treponema sp. OttesenSCG-928-L16]